MSVTPLSSALPPPPEVTRVRQTVRTGPSFADLLKGGLGLIVSGAAVAAGTVGAPLLTSAVRTTAGSAGGAGSATAGAATSGGAGGNGGDGDMMQQMRELQRESRDMNLEMLALQEQVQQENRRFTTASNLLKARHDTAKAAIGNIRP
jgi:hypothetical protein